MEVSKVDVFLHGTVDGEDLWYRVELEKTFPKDKRKISPVAALSWERYGFEGSWDVVNGDEIYWVGGHKSDDNLRFQICSELLKHKISSSTNPRDWETVSSMRIPRASPFFSAVGDKKLYVVLGTDHRPNDDVEDLIRFGKVDWDRCGEVYDIQHKTWEYLAPEFDEFEQYETFHTALVKGENDEPTNVAFIDLLRPLMFFNFRKQTLQAAPASCLNGCTRAPVGRQGCKDKHPLAYAVDNFDRVFDNNTFYWFARDLRLYGYDIDCQTWLVSPSLEDISHTLPRFPILVGLGSGNFLVIVDEPDDRGSFTMASLAVHRDKDEQGYCFLSVSVKSLQAFSLDNHAFQPIGAKAVKLKNTALRGQLQVMDDVLSYQKDGED